MNGHDHHLLPRTGWAPPLHGISSMADQRLKNQNKAKTEFPSYCSHCLQPHLRSHFHKEKSAHEIQYIFIKSGEDGTGSRSPVYWWFHSLLQQDKEDASEAMVVPHGLIETVLLSREGYYAPPLSCVVTGKVFTGISSLQERADVISYRDMGGLMEPVRNIKGLKFTRILYHSSV